MTVLVVVLLLRPRAARPLLIGAANGGHTILRTALLAAIAGGLLDIAGFVAFAVGLEGAPAWIVGLASSFGPVVSVLVAVLLWRERLQPSQWVGLVGIALGLVAVAVP
jgi:drug/metabolite transporter (DMT)-like permease